MSQCSDCGCPKPEAELQIIKHRKYCMWCAEEKEMESERKKQRMLGANKVNDDG